jgi:excisionase family DNA binding protein
MPDLKCLTTKEVARLCRVSDASVKRWEAAGLLKSERTSGGHRRFRAEEVARFQREQNLGLKQFHGDESVAKATVRLRDAKNRTDSVLLQALLAGCEESAANVLINAHLQGELLTEIFDREVCPVMRKIGELWFNGKITIAQEHLATRVASNAIYKLRNTLAVPKMTNDLALCCAMEGEFHEFPVHLAQVSIENEGWEVINFGANTPLYCLAEEVARHAPRVICISATIIGDLERLAREYKLFTEQISKLKTSIVLGGRVFEDEPVRRRFPAHFYAQSFGAVAGFVRGLTKA